MTIVQTIVLIFHYTSVLKKGVVRFLLAHKIYMVPQRYHHTLVHKTETLTVLRKETED